MANEIAAARLGYRLGKYRAYRISKGRGPPTDQEIMAHGEGLTTPDGAALHGALKPNSPRAHDKCCRFMHAINLRVAAQRCPRSKGPHWETKTPCNYRCY